MRLKIQNIGMISNADILLDGLTVIAGENDTGKSTVGKILFCLIKSVSRYQEDFSESKEHQIIEILDNLHFIIRRTAHIINESELDTLNSLFSYDYSFWLDKELWDNKISQLKKYVGGLDINETTFSQYYQLIDQIETIIMEPEDKNKYIQSALNRVFRAEFDSKILKHNTKSGKIELYENELQLLNINIENNNKISLSQNCQPLYFNDVTFIETPLILNNHDLLMRATTGINATKSTSRRLGLPYTTLHTKDLFDKLKENRFAFLVEDTRILNHEIKALINGELIYDNDDNDFKYIKSDNKIPIKNTATGIKSFGILQILAENEFLNKKSFLILDEPEIHLHPKWQLKYAQLIALLIKNSVPVLVTSHSPYMIEALQKYSDNNLNVNFYLTKDENIEKISNDNSQTLSAIFSKLSEPFEEFDKLDSEKLQNG